MMKKVVLTAVGVVVLTIAFANFYKVHKIKSVMEESISIMAHYIRAMENASTPEAMAKATRNYALEVRQFGTKLKDLKAHYPEIENQRKAPDWLQDLTLEHEQRIKDLMTATAKMRPHREHKQVKAANDDLVQAWIDTK